MESVLSEYEASLADLTFNSKPHINMLTVLAEENVSFASDIVKIIETRLFEVQFKRKLPVLYLIDSIVKNFGGRYMKLFGHNLISVFLCVFDKADGKTRADMYKLRCTWDGIFPARLLHQLDKAVQDVDHRWPIRTKKHFQSKNPLSLGEATPPSATFSADDDAGADEPPPPTGDKSGADQVEELVEEEEIEMDDESLGVLEMLEQKLKKRQAELSRLEYLESTRTDDYRPLEDAKGLPGSNSADKGVADGEGEESDSDENPLKIDLNEYPVIPMDSIKDDSPVVEEKPAPSFDEDLMDTKHWGSRSSSFEARVAPGGARRAPDDFERFNTNRVVSHFKEEPEPLPIQVNDIPTDTPAAAVRVKRSASTSTGDAESQTTAVVTTERAVQNVPEMKDESTLFRYKRKTKNFTSQYRVATKTVGTFFKIKQKDAITQYEAPENSQDGAADSTCLPLDDDVPGSQQLTSSAKESQNRHSVQILRSLRRQRQQGMLCDITLSAEEQLFKAHKSLLAACSDFFHALFASEEIKQTPLSYIELQGITAAALSLVLDYIYTSRVSVSGSAKSVQEIITAAKRLKIQSLIPVCEVLEEALASDQDLTGYVISNTELVGPDSSQSNGVAQRRSASITLPSSDEADSRKFSDDDDDDDSDASIKARRSSSSRKPRKTKSDRSVVDSSGGEKSSKPSASDTHRDKKPVKRKDRSQSEVIESSVKRKKSEDPAKPYPCPHCKKAFRDKRNLNFHLARSHPGPDSGNDVDGDEEEEEKQVVIRSTSSATNRRKKTQQEATVVEDSKARCDQCAQTFKTAAQLAAHARRKHPREKKRRRGRRDECSSEKEPGSDSDARPVRDRKSEKVNSSSKEPKSAPTAPSKDTSASRSPSDTDKSQVDPTRRLYQCEICEEVFSVQCFYKAHMADHRPNTDMLGLL